MHGLDHCCERLMECVIDALHDMRAIGKNPAVAGDRENQLVAINRGKVMLDVLDMSVCNADKLLEVMHDHMLTCPICQSYEADH